MNYARTAAPRARITVSYDFQITVPSSTSSSAASPPSPA